MISDPLPAVQGRLYHVGVVVRDVDVVVTLGREARVDPVPDTRFECWDTDEPSERGIDGIERMRLVRDDG